MGKQDHPERSENDVIAGALPLDTVGLLEGISTTRAIRRYHNEPVPPEVLRAILFSATRAPSGSNRQPFRMLVLTDGPRAGEAKRLIGISARQVWGTKRQTDAYDSGSGVAVNSPKSRAARALQHYVDDFENIPVLILACLIRYRPANSFEGASVFPACQNILLAARALGYGGVLTGFHFGVEGELRALLGVPDDVFMAATITLGRPIGSHGPVRRRPMAELVFADAWNNPAAWAVDPPGTRHTSAGPPRQRSGTTPVATADNG